MHRPLSFVEMLRPRGPSESEGFLASWASLTSARCAYRCIQRHDCRHGTSRSTLMPRTTEELCSLPVTSLDSPVLKSDPWEQGMDPVYRKMARKNQGDLEFKPWELVIFDGRCSALIAEKRTMTNRHLVPTGKIRCAAHGFPWAAKQNEVAVRAIAWTLGLPKSSFRHSGKLADSEFPRCPQRLTPSLPLLPIKEDMFDSDPYVVSLHL